MDVRVAQLGARGVLDAGECMVCRIQGWNQAVIKRWLLSWVLGAAIFAGGGANADVSDDLRLAEVAVTISDDAFIDWNRTSAAIYTIQNDIIRDIFRSAAIEGVSDRLTGPRDAVLAIDVTYFDILSDLEKFFCCAKNEVMATFTLLDASTGDALTEPAPLKFDHVGRGGFLLLFSLGDNETQLSRLYDLIAEGARDWLAKL